MLDILWLAILLGLYVGVIPVYIGMMPLKSLRNLDGRWMTFLLSFTVGVLLFLLIDLGAEAMEGADAFIADMQVADTGTGAVPALDEAIFNLVGLPAAASAGYVIFIVGLLIGVLGLVWTDAKVRARANTSNGEAIAWMIAVAIGLHNMGEGLAVGIAVSAGAAALASSLVVGFALHNLSEGIAVVGPLAREGGELNPKKLIGMGAVAGGPTIIGAFIGLSWFANSLAIFFFAIAAGAVLYVIVEVMRTLKVNGGAEPDADEESDAKAVGHSDAWIIHVGVVAGILVMFVTSLFVTL